MTRMDENTFWFALASSDALLFAQKIELADHHRPASHLDSTGTSGARVELGGRPRIGWVPQQPAQYGRLSPRENLELFARLERP